jgi:transposase
MFSSCPERRPHHRRRYPGARLAVIPKPAGVLAQIPDPRVRRERELARFRLHLVKHRSQLKNWIHSTLISSGAPARSQTSSGSRAASCSPSSICRALARNIDAGLALIDQLEAQVAEVNAKLRASGAGHPRAEALDGCRGSAALGQRPVSSVRGSGRCRRSRPRS